MRTKTIIRVSDVLLGVGIKLLVKSEIKNLLNKSEAFGWSPLDSHLTHNGKTVSSQMSVCVRVGSGIIPVEGCVIEVNLTLILSYVLILH